MNMTVRVAIAAVVWGAIIGAGAAFGQTPAYNYQYDAANQATATFPGKTINWQYVTTPLAGQTATGTNQATALDTSASGLGLIVFTTVASGTGARIDSDLPVGGQQTFANRGANALTLYPPLGSGATINGASSASVPAGGAYTVTLVDATHFLGAVTAGAGGSGGGSIPATGVVLCGSGLAGVAQACGSLDGIASSGGNIAVNPGPGLIQNAGKTQVDAGTGLAFSGNSLTVSYGTSAGTALQGSLKNAASGVAPLDANSLVPMGNLATSVAYAGIAFNWAGIPVSGYTVRSVTMPWGCAVPVNYAGSGGYIDTASTTSATVAIASISGGSSTSRGTWTNTAGHALAPPAQSGYSLAAGDVLTATVSTGDATAADFSLTVRCAKATP